MWNFFKQHLFLPDVWNFDIKYYFIPTLSPEFWILEKIQLFEMLIIPQFSFCDTMILQ